MGPVFFGIDPGANGAIAKLDPDGRISAVLPLRGSTLLEAVEFIQTEQLNEAYAYIEQLHAAPRGSIAAWSLGKSYGALQGILVALRVPVVEVSPQKWKAAFGLTARKSASDAEKKAASREMAQKLFPAAASLFRRVKDDGAAEAALIAEYGRRTRFGG